MEGFFWRGYVMKKLVSRGAAMEEGLWVKREAGGSGRRGFVELQDSY
jgi:hypothetical protein